MVNFALHFCTLLTAAGLALGAAIPGTGLPEATSTLSSSAPLSTSSCTKASICSPAPNSTLSGVVPITYAGRSGLSQGTKFLRLSLIPAANANSTAQAVILTGTFDDSSRRPASTYMYDLNLPVPCEATVGQPYDLYVYDYAQASADGTNDIKTTTSGPYMIDALGSSCAITAPA